MSEMVERVARAIAGEAFAESHEGDAESEWQKVKHLARAAIEALREPTEEMEWLGDDAHDPHVRNASEIWQTMIDAALK